MMYRRSKDGPRLGPSPKELTLISMGGCTAIDVIDILHKMRQPVESLAIELECEDTEEHPRVFRQVRLLYRFRGAGLDPQRAHRAVELSMEKYCGVSAMIRKTAAIEWAVEVNGERVDAPRPV